MPGEKSVCGGIGMKKFPVFHTAEEEEGRWKRLSLGSGVSVPNEDILGIFDMDTATMSPVTKKFLNTAQKNGCVSVVGEELPKSFVVVAPKVRLVPGGHGDDDNNNKNPNHANGTLVALSQFTPSTLCGRGDSL